MSDAPPAGDLFGQPLQPRPAAYAQVAPEQGVDIGDGTLTYAVPEHLADLQVGQRVRVPLGRGNKPVSGYVVQLADTCDAAIRNLKAIQQRDPQGLSLPVELIELAKWIAGYYCSPLGMVLATMLPAAVKRGTGTVTQTQVGLPEQMPEPQPRLTSLQRKVMQIARDRADGGNAWTQMKDLADLAGARSVSPVKQLVEKQMLATRQATTVVSDLDLRAQKAAEGVGRHTLHTSQQHALDHLITHLAEGFGVHLLHGVTGSGKTEVYLRLIEHVLQQGDADDAAGHRPGVIVLVPEISLTPQTVARFLSRFDAVAVLHSGLTAAQRHAQWRRIRDGKANIVVGARSAIFAPLSNLQLVIVDEEHEHSYKQDQIPRYHGRDVAIKRAQMHQIPIVLGSATPSLESYLNAVGLKPTAESRDAVTPAIPAKSFYHLIRMPDRAPGMQLPHVEVVDLQEERRSRRGIHLLSQRLEHELRSAFDEGQDTDSKGGRAILLLNRRGYANYIACPDHTCGWQMHCDYCDAAMVYHKDRHLPRGGVVRCHHCSAEQLLPRQCPVCEKNITVFGLGTQRVEEELATKFPHLRSLRMDGDTMRSGRDYQTCLDQFRQGEVDVLLGTQMIAKGLDFPTVRLVGVISADTALNLPDFRAAERTFQLIAQVAGRAGRSDQRGKVIVQSFNPHDPAIQSAAEHDYEGFAARELEYRAQVGLPPIARMARIVVRNQDHDACMKHAYELAEHLKRFDTHLSLGVRITGPMPCPIARIANYHRHQIELVADNAGPIQKLLTALRNERLLVSDAQMAVDVDPVALL